MPNWCTQGVQHQLGFQSAVNRGRREEDKDKGSLGFDHGQRGESIGAVTGASSGRIVGEKGTGREGLGS
jgi:hypothetical protein